MRIDQALGTYGSIHALLLEMEQLLNSRRTAELVEKQQQVARLQEQAKVLDKEILAQMQEGGLNGDGRVAELLDLMQAIQSLNRRITPQLQAIMAVQREEIRKIRTGSTMMRGYHSNNSNSGRLVSRTG